MDRMTLAVAAGSAIAMGGQEAFDSWQRSRKRGELEQTEASGQRAAILRLASLFPGSVKEH